MKWIKQLLLIVISTVVVAYLLKWSSDYLGFRSPAFAFFANLLIMVWIALLSQVWVFAYPPGYFVIKPFEKEGRIYEKLGIVFFKKLIRGGSLLIFNPTRHLSENAKSISGLENEMRKAEAGHLTVFLVVLLFACMAMVRGWFDAGGWLLLFSIILNGYPIMLQRYNRIRLHQIVANQNKKAKKQNK